MEKEEIVSGIKQAIERGYSLEQAKRSFINAGYSIEDVEDSAKSFSGLLANIPSKPLPMQSFQLSQPQPPKPEQKQKSYALIILLVIVLLLLLAGLIATIFFKEKIIEFLQEIF